ncbi:outer membrane protein assembly factor BamB family protein [Thermopirellula anaerolimosa]
MNMKRSLNVLRIGMRDGAAMLVALLTIGVSFAPASEWRHFRGTDQTAAFRPGEDVPPVRSLDQLAWKTELPGRGPSSPIVTAGRVFVTSAMNPKQEELRLSCFDAASGKTVWETRFWATGSTVCNSFGGVAGSTPTSDGRLIVVQYSSNDLACFDLDGRPRWFRGLGLERPFLRNDVGMASSPRIVDDVVVVQAESLLDAVVTGLSLQDGRTLWQIDRPKQAMWSSPVAFPPGESAASESDAGPWVLIQSREDFALIDPKTGRTVASYGHWCDTVPTAAVWGSHVALPAAGIHLLAFDSAKRTLNANWISDRLRVANSSPLLCRNRLYTVKPPNILVCADAQDGTILGQMRLGGSFWASPVIAGRTLYLPSYEGTLYAVSLDEDGVPRQREEIELESQILASPAVDESGLYIRTRSYLWKFAFGSK